MSSILTNTSAMTALQTLKGINSDLAKTQDEISTGKKVANAKDNAAIFAISKVMESDVAGFKAISDSLSLGASTVAVASNATEQIGGLLEEIKGKIVAANEDNVDRSVLQDEIEQLRGQITGIVGAAQFNGKNLLQTDEQTTILASLDRDATGGVSASQITVNGRDFGTAAGIAGTDGSGKNFSLGTANVAGNTATIAVTDATDVLTDAGAGTESFALNVDGTELTFTLSDLVAEGIVAAGDDASDADVATFIGRAINGTLDDDTKNFTVQGLTATVDTQTADATVTIESTASEDISLARTDAANGTIGAPSSASLGQVDGEINQRASVGIDLVDANADADGQTFSVSVGENTFTFTNDATNPGDTAAAAVEIVDALNAAATEDGVDGLLFEVDSTTDTQINVVNLDTTKTYDVSFATDFGTNSGNVVADGTTLDPAEARSVDLEVRGTIVEGDSFSVTLGDYSATYVAGKNETSNDVIRGLQNVLAADGPAGLVTGLDPAGNPESDSAVLSLSGDVGYEVSISEARGGSQATGDLYGLSKIDVSTTEGAAKALGQIENLIQTNVDAQAEFGASERRVDLQSDFMSSLIDSFKSGIGSLVDADMEAASARLQALQVQQQLATQSLTIANQAPQNILALFR